MRIASRNVNGCQAVQSECVITLRGDFLITIEQILQLNEISDRVRLWRYCVGIGKKLGFDIAIYACPPPNKKPTDPNTIARFHGLSFADFQKFAFNGLVGEGHITTSNSLLEAKPFRWSDIEIFTSNKSDFLKLQSDARQAGVGDGWIFPLFGPQGRTGLASFGKPNDQTLMEEKVGRSLHVFVETAHLRFCQLTPKLFKMEKPLSRRETQIIAWAAHGKSNTEISKILNISEGSIDSYMRRAFAKLDVHDRTSAAVKAISMDIVRT